jgi:shikimate kinase / 3-dehydroquinate synthase
MSVHPWQSSIFLYGPPGSGKSRAGQALASDLALPFVDLDTQIERASGIAIAKMVETQGEAAFREQERASLTDAAQSGPAVVALGGGALLDPANRATAEAHGAVVCLGASIETLLERVAIEADTRPLLAGDLPGKLSALLARRAEHYASFPLQIVTDRLDPADAAWQVQVSLGRFFIHGDGDGYPVTLETQGLAACGEALQARGLKGPVALVSDENVAPLHAAGAAQSLRECGYAVAEIVIPAGEAHKTVDTVSRLWSGYLAAGLERTSTVVALGGGVLSDLAGFGAATFLRGVRWAVLPTTLLAMIDAGLGGKTGADLPAGKNLVGAFYPPRLVLADPLVLETLPPVEIANGMGEVVKHGVIGDPRLFEICSGGPETVRANWDELLRRAIAVKVRVVREDPLEQGRRAALNLGHTIGHAVETVSRYRLRHGEAVAIGMVAEARLAERIGLARSGLAAQIGAALAGLGLPVEIPADLPAEEIERAMLVDKKRKDGSLRFALPAAIGDVRVGIEVAQEDVENLLKK